MINDKCSIIFKELPLLKIQLPLDSVYCFGYDFSDSDYKEALKRKDSIPYDTKHRLINNAIKRLHKDISIYSFDTLLFQKFRSSLNSSIVNKLVDNVPDLNLLTINNSNSVNSFEFGNKEIQCVSVAKKILLIDDVTLPRVSLIHYLYAIRGINHTAPIVIFTFSNAF